MRVHQSTSAVVVRRAVHFVRRLTLPAIRRLIHVRSAHTAMFPRWWAAAVVLALASNAAAKCVNIPLCLPPYSPPVDGLILYEDNIPMHEWASVCLPKVKSCLGRPFWAPAGGLRTTAWYCAENDAAMLSITLTRNGVESARTREFLDD